MYRKIYKYIYTNMKINKYIEMHVAKNLFEIINEYIKNRNNKKYVKGVKIYIETYLKF